MTRTIYRHCRRLCSQHFLFLAIVFLPLLANSSGYTGIKILNESPINIACGSSVDLKIEFSYFRSENDDDDYDWYFSVYQYRSGWFDDQLGFLKIAMPKQKGNGKFVVEMTVNCDVQESGKCKFFGPNTSGAGQSPHLIYAELGSVKSTKVTVNCKKPDGTFCYVIPQDDPIHQGGSSAIAIAVKSPVRAVKEVDLLMTHDAADFTVANAAFTPSFLSNCSSSNIDKSIPGRIRFRATLKTPRPITEQTNIATYTLQANSNTAYGPYMINVDTSSKLFDPSHHFIDAQLGEQTLAIAPVDNSKPTINSSMINNCEDKLSGKAGAVNDNFISLDNYVSLLLYKNENDYAGTAKLNTDGSFLVDGLHIREGDNLHLTATDFAGNSAVYAFRASISPNGCTNEVVTTERMGTTISGTVVSNDEYKKSTFTTPNGNVVLYTTTDQDILQNGKTLTGTVTLEPNGNRQKDKDQSLKELKKCVLVLGETAVALNDIEQLVKYTGHREATDHFDVSLADNTGKNKETVSWIIPKDPVAEYSGPGQASSLFMNEKMVMGENIVAVHTQPIKETEFAETDQFTITDSKGKSFPVNPIAESPTSSVIKIPDAAAKGNITISRSRNGIEMDKTDFDYSDLKLSSPNTNLKKGEKSFVLAQIIHGDEAADKPTPNFQLDLQNLNPNVVSMEGGNLQRLSFPISGEAGNNNTWSVKRVITGIVPGTFSVNATLNKDDASSNDAFTPQKEVLRSPEQFNSWVNALKNDLQSYAMAQENTPRGQNIWRNTSRAIANIRNCNSPASLGDCKRLADQLLEPLQIPKAANNSWLCAYEAMRSAGSQLNDAVAGKEVLVSWRVMQNGLELVKNMGEYQKDKIITDDAISLLNELPHTGDQVSQPTMADINMKLQSLTGRCEGRIKPGKNGYLKYALRDLLSTSPSINNTASNNDIQPKLMVGYLDAFSKTLWVDIAERDRILAELNARKQSSGKYMISSVSLSGKPLSYLLDVVPANPGQIIQISDEKDEGIPFDIDKSRKEEGNGKKEAGKPIDIEKPKPKDPAPVARKSEDNGIPLDIPKEKRVSEDDGLPVDDIIFTPKYGGTFTDSTGTSYRFWKRAQCVLFAKATKKHSPCEADGNSVWDSGKKEFKFVPDGNFCDFEYYDWYECKGGHANENCTETFQIVGLHYVYSDKNCTKLTDVVKVMGWSCK